MDHQRPRGREKHVTGPGKSVNKRGEGLHTGPVGDAGGYADRKEPSGGSGQRSGGTRSGGGMKLLILLAVLRIYAHFVLGMSKTDIARAEGVDEKVVRLAIERGLRNMEKFLKNNF